MDDDFNTSGALATLFELVKAINTARDQGVAGSLLRGRAAHACRAAGCSRYLAVADGVRSRRRVWRSSPLSILLIEVRTEMRAIKQWALADKIRDQLNELGVVLEDSREGTTWRFEE
jgi:cysteinyl-tRNA synthetase